MKMKALKHRVRSAFTLIELLTAMAILSIISIMMVTIFIESDRIWFFGTDRAVNCTAGRAALNLLAHDLQYAVADDVLTFASRPNPGTRNQSLAERVTYGFTNHEICFVSLQHDSTGAGTPRTAREVFYWVRQNPERPAGTYELVRGYHSGTIYSSRTNHCYFNTSWFEPSTNKPMGAGRPAGYVVAENVSGFSLRCADTDTNGTDTIATPYYSTNFGNRLPQYVDVYLEVLDDSAQERVLAIANNNQKREYIERNARRYTTRVYFQNRYGYKTR